MLGWITGNVNALQRTVVSKYIEIRVKKINKR